ncbi:MAG TPA: anti-sigma factor [Gaiellaceae bacterium]
METDTIHELTAAYALDALDDAEVRRYEDHLAHCPRCREDLASFAEAASSLAYASAGPAPSPTLRTRILEQARSERPNVVPLRRRVTWIATAAAAAAACAALGLGLWAASLSRSLDRERGRQAAVAAVLGDPAARRFTLSSGHGSLVVARTGRAVLLVSGFQRAPSGKVYEAWVVQNGTPRRAGTFKKGQTAALLTTRVPQGAKVLVTQERAPGVDQPTSTPITGTQA